MSDTDTMADLDEMTIQTTPSTANMRLETKKFVLQALLEKASSVLPTRDVMPVLKNFQVEVTAGRIRVVATDLELSVLAATEMVKVQEEGTAVFPGKRLLDIVKEAEDGDLLLDVVDGTAHISIGRASWTLKLQDGTEYPPLPETDEVEFFSVERMKLLSAINSVRYAAATDTVRPSLMLIDVHDGRMRASDGVRFQQVDIAFPLDVQIPINAVDDLVKLLRTTELATVEVGESEDHLVFRVGADAFIANKLTAQFPEVDEVLLKPALTNDQELNVDREELMAAIKRVRITADDETSAVVLALSENKLSVRSQDKFGNTADEGLDVRWEGEDREVAFNHQHLSQMLEMADAKSCSFFLGPDGKTRKSPLLLRDDESGQLGVLNQIRLDFLS